MDKVIDARGLLCPEPVLLTKKAIDGQESGSLKVLVDNTAAKENVTRLCENKGWTVKIADQGSEFLLILHK